MKFTVLTLFPQMIESCLKESITGRAIENGLISLNAVNIRDFANNKHNKVDDYPYGGGAGMLMQAEPVFEAWNSVTEGRRVRTVYVTPQGHTFNQHMAEEFAKEEEIVFLCGHYEGIDERVLEEVVTDYVSVGDYVLTGGEMPAMVMIDAIARLVPGVLNNDMSAETESFHANLLEHPHYSRPEVWHEKSVPSVLLSGNQKNIDAWRKEESVKRTKERRPDLFEKYERLVWCRDALMKSKLHNMDMIELINQGKAELIFSNDKAVILREINTNIFFHGCLGKEIDEDSLKILVPYAKEEDFELIIHQEQLVPKAEKLLGIRLHNACYQVVYTNREKLSKAKTKVDFEVRQLGPEHREIVAENYEMADDPAYVYDRIYHGQMYGAFVGEKLAGFIGRHPEGSGGLLFIFPEFRGMGLAKALEVFLTNDSLEKGFTPYGQVVKTNEASIKLQEAMGFHFAKEKVFWMGK